MAEIVFEVTQEPDGGLVAECLTESIFTQAGDWEELRQNVKEAVAAFYFDPAPTAFNDPPSSGTGRGPGLWMRIRRDLSLADEISSRCSAEAGATRSSSRKEATSFYRPNSQLISVSSCPPIGVSGSEH